MPKQITMGLGRIGLACLFVWVNVVTQAEESADPFPDLAGKEVDLWFEDGTYLENVAVVTCNRTKDELGLKSLTYRLTGSKKLLTAPAFKIKEILRDNLPLDVEFDTKAKVSLVSLKKRGRRLEELGEINKRLSNRGSEIYETPTDREAQQAYKKLTDHVKDAQTAFPQWGLTLSGGPLCLLMTDLPPETAQAVLQRCEQTYETLCRMSGVPVGKNVWRGGMLIVLISKREAYSDYEKKFAGGQSRGVEDKLIGYIGTVRSIGEYTTLITKFYPPQTPNPRVSDRAEQIQFGELARTLTWAYFDRCFTSARLPFWLSTAISSAMSLPKDQLVREASVAVQKIAETGTLRASYYEQEGRSGNFASSSDSALAVDVLFFLQDEKPKHFPKMMYELLWGQLWETALKEHYGWTVDEMLRAYLKKRGAKDVKLTKD